MLSYNLIESPPELSETQRLSNLSFEPTKSDHAPCHSFEYAPILISPCVLTISRSEQFESAHSNDPPLNENTRKLPSISIEEESRHSIISHIPECITGDVPAISSDHSPAHKHITDRDDDIVSSDSLDLSYLSSNIYHVTSSKHVTPEHTEVTSRGGGVTSADTILDDLVAKHTASNESVAFQSSAIKTVARIEYITGSTNQEACIPVISFNRIVEAVRGQHQRIEAHSSGYTPPLTPLRHSLVDPNEGVELFSREYYRSLHLDDVAVARLMEEHRQRVTRFVNGCIEEAVEHVHRCSDTSLAVTPPTPITPPTSPELLCTDEEDDTPISHASHSNITKRGHLARKEKELSLDSQFYNLVDTIRGVNDLKAMTMYEDRVNVDLLEEGVSTGNTSTAAQHSSDDADSRYQRQLLMAESIEDDSNSSKSAEMTNNIDEGYCTLAQIASRGNETLDNDFSVVERCSTPSVTFYDNKHQPQRTNSNLSMLVNVDYGDLESQGAMSVFGTIEDVSDNIDGEPIADSQQESEASIIELDDNIYVEDEEEDIMTEKEKRQVRFSSLEQSENVEIIGQKYETKKKQSKNKHIESNKITPSINKLSSSSVREEKPLVTSQRIGNSNQRRRSFQDTRVIGFDIKPENPLVKIAIKNYHRDSIDSIISKDEGSDRLYFEISSRRMQGSSDDNMNTYSDLQVLGLQPSSGVTMPNQRMALSQSLSSLDILINPLACSDTEARDGDSESSSSGDEETIKSTRLTEQHVDEDALDRVDNLDTTMTSANDSTGFDNNNQTEMKSKVISDHVKFNKGENHVIPDYRSKTLDPTTRTETEETTTTTTTTVTNWIEMPDPLFSRSEAGSHIPVNEIDVHYRSFISITDQRAERYASFYPMKDYVDGNTQTEIQMIDEEELAARLALGWLIESSPDNIMPLGSAGRVGRSRLSSTTSSDTFLSSSDESDLDDDDVIALDNARRRYGSADSDSSSAEDLYNYRHQHSAQGIASILIEDEQLSDTSSVNPEDWSEDDNQSDGVDQDLILQNGISLDSNNDESVAAEYGNSTVDRGVSYATIRSLNGEITSTRSTMNQSISSDEDIEIEEIVVFNTSTQTVQPLDLSGLVESSVIHTQTPHAPTLEVSFVETQTTPRLHQLSSTDTDTQTTPREPVPSTAAHSQTTPIAKVPNMAAHSQTSPIAKIPNIAMHSQTTPPERYDAFIQTTDVVKFHRVLSSDNATQTVNTPHSDRKLRDTAVSASPPARRSPSLFSLTAVNDSRPNTPRIVVSNNDPNRRKGEQLVKAELRYSADSDDDHDVEVDGMVVTEIASIVNSPIDLRDYGRGNIVTEEEVTLEELTLNLELVKESSICSDVKDTSEVSYNYSFII